MKRVNLLLRIGAILLFVGLIASCRKEKDPYADYTAEREITLIQQWVDAMTIKKMNIDTTSSGILYIQEKAGTGEKVKSGNTVTVKYTGMFLDGSVFDASEFYGNGTFTYIHKTDRMILGWEEGIEVLNKGAKAAFLIPSAKGYGALGSVPVIPPYSPLIFVIEVVDIK